MNEFQIVDTSSKETFYEELKELKNLGYKLIFFSPILTEINIRYIALLEHAPPEDDTEDDTLELTREDILRALKRE